MGKERDDEACCESCKLYGDAPAYVEPAQVAAILAPFETMKIVVTQKGTPYAEVLPDKQEINVGRVSSNDVQLANGTISKRQMRLVFDPRGVIAVDLKSSCGTFINGRLIGKPTIVPEGATVSCGDFELRIVPR
jgi:pSer/pThr/pTyr-binding forkhead associated (FHA) protein